MHINRNKGVKWISIFIQIIFFWTNLIGQKNYKEIMNYPGTSRSYELEDGKKLVVFDDGSCYEVFDTTIVKKDFKLLFKNGSAENKPLFDNKTFLMEIYDESHYTSNKLFNRFVSIDFLSDEVILKLNRSNLYHFKKFVFSIKLDDERTCLINFQSKKYKIVGERLSSKEGNKEFTLFTNFDKDEYNCYSSDLKFLFRISEKENCRFYFLKKKLVSFNEGKKLLLVYNMDGKKTSYFAKSVMENNKMIFYKNEQNQWIHFEDDKITNTNISEEYAENINESIVLFNSYKKNVAIYNINLKKIINIDKYSSYDYNSDKGCNHIILQRKSKSIDEASEIAEVVYEENVYDVLNYANLERPVFTFVSKEARLLNDSIIISNFRFKTELINIRTGKKTIINSQELDKNFLNGKYYFSTRTENVPRYFNEKGELFYQGESFQNSLFGISKMIGKADRLKLPFNTNELWIDLEHANLHRAQLVSIIGDTIISNLDLISEIKTNKLYLTYDKKNNRSSIINTVDYINAKPIIPIDFIEADIESNKFWFPTIQDVYQNLDYVNHLIDSFNYKNAEIKSDLNTPLPLSIRNCGCKGSRTNDNQSKIDNCMQRKLEYFCFIANGIIKDKDLENYNIKNIEISFYINPTGYIFKYDTKATLSVEEKLSVEKSIDLINNKQLVFLEKRIATKITSTIPIITNTVKK